MVHSFLHLSLTCKHTHTHIFKSLVAQVMRFSTRERGLKVCYPLPWRFPVCCLTLQQAKEKQSLSEQVNVTSRRGGTLRESLLGCQGKGRFGERPTENLLHLSSHVQAAFIHSFVIHNKRDNYNQVNLSSA